MNEEAWFISELRDVKNEIWEFKDTTWKNRDYLLSFINDEAWFIPELRLKKSEIWDFKGEDAGFILLLLSFNIRQALSYNLSTK